MVYFEDIDPIAYIPNGISFARVTSFENIIGMTPPGIRAKSKLD